MRILFHAGLHKSGTTTVLSAMLSQLRGSRTVCYPDVTPETGGNHAPLIWPIMNAGAGMEALDHTFHRHLRMPSPSLEEVVAQAESSGFESLVVSSEEMDRMTPGDLERLRELTDRFDSTAIFTVTTPAHRWASAWQELVKYGLGQWPRDASVHIMRFASLQPGRLEELIAGFPARRKLVRIVRETPAEPRLHLDVAAALGLDVSEWPEYAPPQNEGLGVETALLRHLNAECVTTGLLTDHSVDEFRRLGSTLQSRRVRGRPRLVMPPRCFGRAARRELRFLECAREGGDVTVLDPHGRLADWCREDFPSWLLKSTETEWEPITPPRRGLTEDRTWVLRMEKAALERNLARSDSKGLQLE